MLRRFHFILGLAGLVACSKAGAPPKATQSGDNAPALAGNAPSWAQEGNSTTADGYRFVCQGEGRTPEQATQTAKAFCEDEICQLCGVEVESVVTSKETLTGVEASREVVERCRRVRSEPARVLRQSMDCPFADSCIAWIEIEYSNEQKESECKAFGDENFDDPGLCEKAIEDFKGTTGYDAASFRRRVAHLETAKTACANIDVRPTPLLNALSKKLDLGMATWFPGAPRYLANYWLASYAPLFAEGAETTTFVGRIELYLAYLRTKVVVMDAIEASLAPPEILDTEEGLAKLVALLKRTPKDLGYGVQDAHFFALDQLKQMDRKKFLSQRMAPIWGLFSGLYEPSELGEWSKLTAMIWLMRYDRIISDAEWRYTQGFSRFARVASELFEVEDHGAKGKRNSRFRDALKRVLEEGGANSGKSPVAPTKSLLPYGIARLDFEPFVPEAARRELYAFDALKDAYDRVDEELTKAERERFLTRLTKALVELPEDEKAARNQCLGASRSIEFLVAEGVEGNWGKLACGCIDGPLAKDGSSLSNKSYLYDIAVEASASCVRSIR